MTRGDLLELAAKAKILVDDVMPQMGKLCIQDFANLNELCMLLSRLDREHPELFNSK